MRTPMALRTGRHQARDRSLTAAVVGSVVVVVAGSVAQLVNHAFHLGSDALESADDGGVFGFVGDLVAVAAAVAAWLLLARVRPVRPVVAALPPLLTVIALDKVFRWHDEIPSYLVLYAPVLVAAFLCVLDIARRVPRSTARLLLVGLALLAASFALHVIGGRILDVLGLADSGWGRQVKAVVKHGFEVQGWSLLLIGLAATALRIRPRSGAPARRAGDADLPSAG